MNGGDDEAARAIALVQLSLLGIPAIAAVDARTFQRAVELALAELGCRVRPEATISVSGRRRRLNLVVTAPLPIAVEIDRVSPRRKSIQTLRAANA